MRTFPPFWNPMAGVLLVVLATSTCTLLPQNPARPVPPAQESLIIADTDQLAQKQFALGAYGKALAIYSAAYDRYHLPGLRPGYLRLGEQVRAASDSAYQRSSFLEAGIAYRMLYECGITTRDFAGSLSFDDGYLDKQIKACSNALIESGLTKYREERLDEAITIWKKVLAFDANNKSAKSAIDTATAQLQRLKTMK